MSPSTLYFAQERPRARDIRSKNNRRCRVVFNGIGHPVGGGLIKIGLAYSVAHRLQKIGSQVERSMVLLGVIEGARYAEETAMHSRFRAAHAWPGRPWGREWFTPLPALVEFVAALSVPYWVDDLPFLVPLPTGTS